MGSPSHPASKEDLQAVSRTSCPLILISKLLLSGIEFLYVMKILQRGVFIPAPDEAGKHGSSHELDAVMTHFEGEF